MKPRFGDEYKVGFHIFYHCFQFVDFFSINYVHCNIDIVNFALVRCYLNLSPVLVVLCASFFAFLQYVLSFLVLALLPGLQVLLPGA